MTKVKLCGLKRDCDIEAVNELLPDYIGFVLLFEKSRRCITPERAKELKSKLDKRINAVGVFVDAPLKKVAALLADGTIDTAQLHGNESEEYIKELKALTGKPVIKAFSISDKDFVEKANSSSADYVLIDSGKGNGISYDFSITKGIEREYFLAGGVTIENVAKATDEVHPYAVDISSGIETDGLKDKNKMAQFVSLVRGKDDNYD